jgi:agmatine deiminase
MVTTKITSMKTSLRHTLLTTAFTLATVVGAHAQAIQSRMPAMEAPHEGTWLQWPHHYTYGMDYRNDLDPTWVAMTRALVPGEKVHIIAYNTTERTRITNLLTASAVPLTKVDFQIRQTDDTWVRDNGPIFVFDPAGTLQITDWGFDGWGDDTPYAKDDAVPASVAAARNLTRVDLNATVLEGGSVELDGHGVLMATRSSILDNARNPGLTQSQLESVLRTRLGATKFLWLDGAFGGKDDITDMHIDGFAMFAPNRKIVTMSAADLAYWGLSTADINTLYAATDIAGRPYSFVTLPLTARDVVTTYRESVGSKGSYVNYYVGNSAVLVPTYNDPNDATALGIIQQLYPGRTVTGIDCRNLYINGGMVHCVTQQQPAVAMELSMERTSAGSATLTFKGDTNTASRLQSSTTLAAGSWTNAETFTLSGTSHQFVIPTTSARRFFRVTIP